MLGRGQRKEDFVAGLYARGPVAAHEAGLARP